MGFGFRQVGVYIEAQPLILDKLPKFYELQILIYTMGIKISTLQVYGEIKRDTVLRVFTSVLSTIVLFREPSVLGISELVHLFGI